MRVDQLKLEHVENEAWEVGCKLAVETTEGTVYDVGTHNVSPHLGDVKTYVLTLPGGEIEYCSTLWEVADCVAKVRNAAIPKTHSLDDVTDEDMTDAANRTIS